MVSFPKDWTVGRLPSPAVSVLKPRCQTRQHICTTCRHCFSHTSCDIRAQEWFTLDWDLPLAIVIFLLSVGLFTHSRCFIFRSSDFIRSVCFLLLCSVDSCSAMVLLPTQLYILSAVCLWHCYIAVSEHRKTRLHVCKSATL